MKNKILFILILIFTFFISNVYASDNQYEVLYKMENELKDNTFTIQLGLREESTMAVMNSIVYNQDKLEFVSIEGNDYFTVTKSKDITNGVFKSFKILADSEYGFQKVYYANLTFKIKDDFKKGERTEIYFSGNKVATADELLKTSPSMTFTVFYNKDGTVSYVAQEQNFMTQINMFLTNNWKMVLYCLVGLLVIFIIIRYIIIKREVKAYDTKHNHNHIVEKMKFAKVSKKLQTVTDEKPEKVKIAKLGKWGKKKVKVQTTPVQQANINDLMKAEPTEVVQQPTYQEKGVFIGNQNTGDDNMLPDDFSSFGEASNNYAYDDDSSESEISTEGAANLDNLTNQSLQDDDNNSKLGIFLGFLLLIGGLFNISNVNALNEDEMNNLRNMILGNIAWSAEYDINNDNTIDMLDIIALKDLNNITIIQDTMSVSDSKPSANFNLKSTSKYVRTTRNGTTKVRTTANGKWKKTNNNQNNNSNNNNSSTSTGETVNRDGEAVYTSPETTTKKPEQIDLSNGSDTKYRVTITYSNGYGDYDSIDLPYNGEVEFNTYPKDEGYQNLSSLSCTNGKITNNGFKIKISEVKTEMRCTIGFSESNNIKANINVRYQDADNRIDNNVLNLTNQRPKTYMSRSLKLDPNYTYERIYCSNGFVDYSYENGTFSGRIADRSGTCTIYMKPKRIVKNIYYKGNKIFELSGNYHDTIKNVTLNDANWPNNMKLYCGSNTINPRSVEKARESIGGYTFEGWRYVFDVKIEDTDCTLK